MQLISFQRFTQILGRILILEVLFMAFTLLGLGVFGFFPALLATMAVARQFIRETAEQSIFTMFWRFYKEMFVKGNTFSLPLIAIAFGLFTAIQHFKQLDGTINQIIIYGLYFILFVLLVFMIQGLPSIVHLEISFIHLIRGAFLITLIRPVHTIAVALMLVALGWIGYKLSIFSAILLIVPVVYLWMNIALNAFLGFVTETNQIDHNNPAT